MNGNETRIVDEDSLLVPVSALRLLDLILSDHVTAIVGDLIISKGSDAATVFRDVVEKLRKETAEYDDPILPGSINMRRVVEHTGNRLNEIARLLESPYLLRDAGWTGDYITSGAITAPPGGNSRRRILAGFVSDILARMRVLSTCRGEVCAWPRTDNGVFDVLTRYNKLTIKAIDDAVDCIDQYYLSEHRPDDVADVRAALRQMRGIIFPAQVSARYYNRVPPQRCERPLDNGELLAGAYARLVRAWEREMTLADLWDGLVADLRQFVDRWQEQPIDVKASASPASYVTSGILNAAQRALGEHADSAEGTDAKANSRGKVGSEKWRAAQRRMIHLFQRGKLPKTVRQTANLLKSDGFRYSTIRDAAHRSSTLKAHFGLKTDGLDSKVDSGDTLNELAAQADRATRRMIENLHPKQRRDTELALQGMGRARLPELVTVLMVDPDAGSTGDVPFIEATDQDSREDD